MIAVIDDHREAYGVEPICKVLPIAPSTYRDHVARRRDPSRLSARAKRGAVLKVEVRRVFAENFGVYGTRKIWRQLKRERFDVARCTVARLMQAMGLQGVIRGKPIRTTVGDKTAPCPLDRVNRQFRADRPNALWVSDFTYVATWSGFVYVAFVIDTFARRIVGWRVSRTAHAGAVHDREARSARLFGRHKCARSRQNCPAPSPSDVNRPISLKKAVASLAHLVGTQSARRLRGLLTPVMASASGSAWPASSGSAQQRRGGTRHGRHLDRVDAIDRAAGCA